MLHVQVLTALADEIGTAPAHVDNYAMSDAADRWGPRNDPNRPHFIQGWKDERAGKEPEEPRDINARAAYLSGFMGAKRTKNPLKAA